MPNTRTFLPFVSRRAAFVSTLAVLAGCATATIEDTVPVTSVAPVVAPARVAAAPVASAPEALAPASSGPRDTGTFPNLNIPPQVAAPAFTTVEKVQSTAVLRAAQAGQGSGSAEQAAADNAMLRRLAKSHGAEALNAIEKPAPTKPGATPATAAPAAIAPAPAASPTPAAAVDATVKQE